MADFLTRDPITLNEEEITDMERRKEMDAKRIEEQRQFYEIARKRAAELDVYMEKFQREIVESSMVNCFLDSRDITLIWSRRFDQAIPGDSREREDRRSQRRIQEVCRMASNRVS
jgi:hypothetical protein